MGVVAPEEKMDYLYRRCNSN